MWEFTHGWSLCSKYYFSKQTNIKFLEILQRSFAWLINIYWRESIMPKVRYLPSWFSNRFYSIPKMLPIPYLIIGWNNKFHSPSLNLIFSVINLEFTINKINLDWIFIKIKRCFKSDKIWDITTHLSYWCGCYVSKYYHH